MCVGRQQQQQQHEKKHVKQHDNLLYHTGL